MPLFYIYSPQCRIVNFGRNIKSFCFKNISFVRIPTRMQVHNIPNILSNLTTVQAHISIFLFFIQEFNQPDYDKQGIARMLHTRGKNVCSEDGYLEDEIKTIVKTFANNVGTVNIIFIKR